MNIVKTYFKNSNDRYSCYPVKLKMILKQYRLIILLYKNMDLLYLLFLGFVSAISITIENDSKNVVWKGDSINGYNFKQDAIGNIVITANTENNDRTRLQHITDRKPGSSMCFLNMVPGYKANTLQEDIMKIHECFPISNVMRFMNSNSNYLLYIDDTSITYYGEDSSIRIFSKEKYYVSSISFKFYLTIVFHVFLQF